MNLQAQQHGTVTVLRPRGPLAGQDAADFRGQVERELQAKGGRVVLDFSEVPYLDSAGIEALLDLCVDRAGMPSPRLAKLAETCREALDLTRTLPLLEVFDTVENAVRSLKR